MKPITTLIACLMIILNIHFINTEQKVQTDSGSESCNPEVLKTFGMTNEFMSTARATNPMEKAYCRRNSQTCCSEANILSVTQTFAHGVQEFRKKMEIIEELLTLFKGEKILDLIEEIKEQQNCESIVKDMSVKINDTSYDFFTKTYQMIKLEQIANLLLDVEPYIKKTIWFHGDIICSVCSPLHQKHYKFMDGGSVLEAHMTTCFEIQEERDFEMNMIHFYEDYLQKLVEFVQCGLPQEGDEPSEDSKLIPLNKEVLDEFKQTFKTCSADKELKKPECIKFCSKNLRTYSFPLPNFFRNMQVSLKTIFEAIVGSGIDEYYYEIKEDEWNFGAWDSPVTFYQHNDLVDKFKVDDIQWKYSATKGDNMYREIMSKKFTNVVVNSVGHQILSLVLGFGMLFFSLN